MAAFDIDILPAQPAPDEIPGWKVLLETSGLHETQSWRGSNPYYFVTTRPHHDTPVIAFVTTAGAIDEDDAVELTVEKSIDVTLYESENSEIIYANGTFSAKYTADSSVTPVGDVLTFSLKRSPGWFGMLELKVVAVGYVRVTETRSFTAPEAPVVTLKFDVGFD